MTPRAEKILEAVRAIPEGFVRTYGDVPWHRVVRTDGTLPMGEAQRAMLADEGVPMRDGRVDLARARLPVR
jgi:methylated-DNA-protein-cysteine methyltransferase related protein